MNWPHCSVSNWNFLLIAHECSENFPPNVIYCNLYLPRVKFNWSSPYWGTRDDWLTISFKHCHWGPIIWKSFPCHDIIMVKSAQDSCFIIFHWVPGHLQSHDDHRQLYIKTGLALAGLINTLRPRQNWCHFADYIFKCIFLNENFWILNKISWKFVPKGVINNIPTLVQIMAWGHPGDNPLSEPMMVSLLTHICITRPQWVNEIGSSVLDKCTPDGNFIDFLLIWWITCCQWAIT